MLEGDLNAQKEFDDQLGSNIESARKGFPHNMKHLKVLGMHPNDKRKLYMLIELKNSFLMLSQCLKYLTELAIG